MKKILALILMIMLSFSAMAADVPQAVSRGGTIVVRIPWKWINSAELGPSWWGSIDQAVGESAEHALFPVIPPSKVASYLLGGITADERIRIFSASAPENKALVMNNRPLDDNWYAVIRPESRFGGSFDLYWSVSEWSMTMQDRTAHGNLERDMETSVFPLKITSMDGAKAAWTSVYGGISYTLFEVEGIYIAVIEEKNARAEDLPYTQLYIDAPGYDFDFFYTQMEGYMDGNTGVYCCVLSDEEFQLLKEDVIPRLEHDHSKW